jgi:hypothetical protein
VDNLRVSEQNEAGFHDPSPSADSAKPIGLAIRELEETEVLTGSKPADVPLPDDCAERADRELQFEARGTGCITCLRERRGKARSRRVCS